MAAMLGSGVVSGKSPGEDENVIAMQSHVAA